jgi:CHAT domain-containing protein
MQPRFFRYFAFAADYASQEASVLQTLFEYRVSTKAMLLNSSVKIRRSILESGNEELIAKYLEWVDTKEALAAYYSFSKKELLEQEINIDSLESEANLREKYLSENSEVFKQGFFTRSPEFIKLKSSLKPGEACVEIMQIPVYNRTLTDVSEYYALVIKPEVDNPVLVDINSSKELDDKFYKFYKNSIHLKREDGYSYDKFWAAIAEHLDGIDHVYISNDGIYNQINLNTLKGPSGMLIDEFDISLLTNLSALIDISSTNEKLSSDGEAFLVGFPNYGESDAILPLPGTKKEVEEINKTLQNSQFNSQMVLGDMASEDVIKSLEAPSLLHIATHGFFMEDMSIDDNTPVFGIEPGVAKEKPMLRSGLLLKGASYTFHGIDHKELSDVNNGVLTAYEVMNLNLENTSLVVLSACETGLGDLKTGEGVYGLQRAFLVAGTNALIMSLWKVNDEATQKLMTSFYRNLTSNSYKQAFKEAQLDLKNTFPDPYFWGAFVMIEH